MHNPITHIVASVIIGTAPDGSTLNRWTELTPEGLVSFEDRYVYFISASGQRYGVSNVFQIAA